LVQAEPRKVDHRPVELTRSLAPIMATGAPACRCWWRSA